MHLIIILIFTIFLTACTSRQTNNHINKVDVVENLLVTDSCLHSIHIDKSSTETEDFKDLWNKIEQKGYFFTDDTVVPFVKIIFEPKSADFYSDTLVILDCHIFDSVNIHKIDVQFKRLIDRKYRSNLHVEEWEFKDSNSARVYTIAFTGYLRKDYGVKSPTAVIRKGRIVYVFQTAAYAFINEMEKMEKLVSSEVETNGTNY